MGRSERKGRTGGGGGFAVLFLLGAVCVMAAGYFLPGRLMERDVSSLLGASILAEDTPGIMEEEPEDERALERRRVSEVLLRIFEPGGTVADVLEFSGDEEKMKYAEELSMRELRRMQEDGVLPGAFAGEPDAVSYEHQRIVLEHTDDQIREPWTEAWDPADGAVFAMDVWAIQMVWEADAILFVLSEDAEKILCFESRVTPMREDSPEELARSFAAYLGWEEDVRLLETGSGGCAAVFLAEGASGKAYVMYTVRVTYQMPDASEVISVEFAFG